MKKDIIAMSQKERQRYHLLKMVIDGKITLKETDSLMGVSYRQAKRLKKKLISEGAKGLIQGDWYGCRRGVAVSVDRELNKQGNHLALI